MPGSRTKPRQSWSEASIIINVGKQDAKGAKLADAPDLGSGGATHGGSSPPFRTKFCTLSLQIAPGCPISRLFFARCGIPQPYLRNFGHPDALKLSLHSLE